MTIRHAEGEGVQMRLCSLAEDRRDRDRIAIEAADLEKLASGEGT